MAIAMEKPSNPRKSSLGERYSVPIDGGIPAIYLSVSYLVKH